MQLVPMVRDLSSIFDKSGQIDVMLLIYSKVFGWVPQSKLLLKLGCMGLLIILLKQIRLYPLNREQFVDVSGAFSKTFNASCREAYLGRCF